LQLFAEMSPERAAFSLAARSAVHMFLGGNAVGAAVGCAFLVFSRHWRFWFGTMREQNNSIGKAFIFWLKKPSWNYLVFPNCFAPRRLFELRGVL
jgi:hypothetical protein